MKVYESCDCSECVNWAYHDKAACEKYEHIEWVYECLRCGRPNKKAEEKAHG